MNKLFALILVAGAITFSSCDKKVEEKKEDTTPAKVEDTKPAISEEKPAGEMTKSDTVTNKSGKKVIIEDEKKADKK